MPMYTFKCSKCESKFEELAKFDEACIFPDVKCPECGSKKKEFLISPVSFAFSNPIGTDRWTSDGSGHDYRFHYNAPNVKKQRQIAEATSHMGANPYTDTSEKDLKLGEGIHDPEFRPGLS